MAETHSDSGYSIPAPGVEARQCGGSRHFRRTPSALGFSKEQLKLSGGGVAIITFWNGTFQDDSGNPIAINPFKGAHTVAVTATVSGKIKVYNSTGRVRYACEFDNLQNYIDSGVFISAYYIEK